MPCVLKRGGIGRLHRAGARVYRVVPYPHTQRFSTNTVYHTPMTGPRLHSLHTRLSEQCSLNLKPTNRKESVRHYTGDKEPNRTRKWDRPTTPTSFSDPARGSRLSRGRHSSVRFWWTFGPWKLLLLIQSGVIHCCWLFVCYFHNKDDDLYFCFNYLRSCSVNCVAVQSRWSQRTDHSLVAAC